MEELTMNKLSRDEFYFALSIDGIIPVNDYEAFVNKNKKLCDLYRRLIEYGFHCEYEYAYHDGDEVIPGIIFPEYRDKEELDYGLPGIMVICKNKEFHLLATPDYAGIEQAIEFEVPVNDDDAIEVFEYDEDLNYLVDIFSTKSIPYMYHYLCLLSDLMIENAAYLIPFSKNKVAVYWTTMFSDGVLSYDRINIYEIIPKNGGDWEYVERYKATNEEEKRLGKLYASVKAIIADIQQSYIKTLATE